MKTKTIWIVIVVVIAAAVIIYLLTGGAVTAPTTEDTNGEATTSQGAPLPQEGTSTPVGASSVNVYLVSVGTGEQGGENTVGCGDTIAAVKEDIPQTQGVLVAALDKLFSIKTQQVAVGSTTYYNALYQSDLSVDSAEVVNGVATVKISGKTALGGECDDPRAIAQIRQTVMQFGTVKSADIFINDKPLEDYFSLK
ncbi:MAG TPA: GerMN domain-containing protein [Candidatus Paceibacterota bacterium]|jgi:hypothetical protein|nr:GerMN domain-containing protein [Candidatus Paceibacterota bacterium]